MKNYFGGYLITASIFLVLAFSPQQLLEPVIEGFTPAHSKKEYQLEEKFDSYLSAKDMRKWMKTMTSKPNGLGSPHNKKNAKYLKELFTKWGFDTHIEKFKVLFPTPKERELELVAPTYFKASLREPPIKGDPETYIYKNSLPPYNAYASDGDVTAGLVYVNQGLPRDYKVLAEHGISVKGKIVIAQYGGSWRGLKPRLAHKHGAVGCILYSDSKESGRYVQRGTVMNLSIHPGGPLTPGVGADKNAHRMPRSKSKVIKKIPVLPISYEDAKPLLAALGGPVAPHSWQGDLPITYHIGPGQAKVHLKINFNWNMVTLYDVIAKIKGSIYPDQWVLRGNHHDAWVFGAMDPMSGMITEMGEAKALGKLLKTGWRPKRTIIYCSWDGEEAGMLGSTEWAEKHANELQKNAVLYVNSDVSTRGYFSAKGSQSLHHFINQVGRNIVDPETGVNIIARKQAQRMVFGDKDAMRNNKLPMGVLGTGSDFCAFLQHLGIPSIYLKFSGEGAGGSVYHSRYDTFRHYIQFSDPKFKYGVAMSKAQGHTILRFANADILPYQFSDMAKHLKASMNQIKQKMISMRKEREYQQKLHAYHAYVLASDPTKTYYPPTLKSKVSYIDFAPLENAVDYLSRVAATYDSSFSAQMDRSITLSKKQLAKLNYQLQSIPQALLSMQGLPKRPWYRNMIYGPGYHKGRLALTLPGVRESVEQRKWKRAKKEIIITANTITRYANQIKKATAIVDPY